MANYRYRIYPKGDIDYTLTTKEGVVSMMKKIKDADVVAADSHTAHEMEQLRMDAYHDGDMETVHKLDTQFFYSEAKRKRAAAMRPAAFRVERIGQNSIASRGNSIK